MNNKDSLKHALDLLEDLLSERTVPSDKGGWDSMCSNTNCAVMEFLSQHGYGTITKLHGRAWLYTPNKQRQ